MRFWLVHVAQGTSRLLEGLVQKSNQHLRVQGVRDRMTISDTHGFRFNLMHLFSRATILNPVLKHGGHHAPNVQCLRRGWETLRDHPQREMPVCPLKVFEQWLDNVGPSLQAPPKTVGTVSWTLFGEHPWGPVLTFVLPIPL